MSNTGARAHERSAVDLAYSSVQAFERFYHRESSAGAFARAVLNGYIIKFQTTSLLYSLQEAMHCCRALSLIMLRSYYSLWLCYLLYPFCMRYCIVVEP